MVGEIMEIAQCEKVRLRMQILLKLWSTLRPSPNNTCILHSSYYAFLFPSPVFKSTSLILGEASLGLLLDTSSHSMTKWTKVFGVSGKTLVNLKIFCIWFELALHAKMMNV